MLRPYYMAAIYYEDAGLIGILVIPFIEYNKVWFTRFKFWLVYLFLLLIKFVSPNRLILVTCMIYSRGRIQNVIIVSFQTGFTSVSVLSFWQYTAMKQGEEWSAGGKRQVGLCAANAKLQTQQVTGVKCKFVTLIMTAVTFVFTTDNKILTFHWNVSISCLNVNTKLSQIQKWKSIWI